MAGFCKAGGRVPKKAWVPVGNKDFSSVIASIPEDVDSLLVVLAGADAVNFMRQYEQAGGDKPFIAGSVMVDQTVLSYKGKRRDALVGTLSSGRSEEHTSELQSLMRISYADFCLKKKTTMHQTSSLPYPDTPDSA